MPEVARCNAIEVGEPVLRAGSKIEACDKVEQTLKGAIRAFDRQRFLVKSFDIAADEVSQQPAQGPLPGLVPCSRLRVFAGRCGRSASRDAAAKATSKSFGSLLTLKS